MSSGSNVRYCSTNTDSHCLRGANCDDNCFMHQHLMSVHSSASGNSIWPSSEIMCPVFILLFIKMPAVMFMDGIVFVEPSRKFFLCLLFNSKSHFCFYFASLLVKIF